MPPDRAGHAVRQPAARDRAVRAGGSGPERLRDEQVDARRALMVARSAGNVVGMVMPSANPGGNVIAYAGVVPEHRGNGYVNDLLAEGLRILAAERPGRVTASTDFGNTPMAGALLRAGFDHRFTVLEVAVPV
ncbi:GNAT family N-acetyltransferase [Salininema proteolyticum]|uniref:GNAT family N-acetyltransferase n=1 Tax=Salininema proteolyticum TaxID=1607685 RepID=A0ABV8U1K5_9ACTN